MDWGSKTNGNVFTLTNIISAEFTTQYQRQKYEEFKQSLKAGRNEIQMRRTLFHFHSKRWMKTSLVVVGKPEIGGS